VGERVRVGEVKGRGEGGEGGKREEERRSRWYNIRRGICTRALSLSLSLSRARARAFPLSLFLSLFLSLSVSLMKQPSIVKVRQKCGCLSHALGPLSCM
jgi:hypothetical protein